MSLSHELYGDGDRCCLTLHGEIDLAVYEELHAALQQAVGLGYRVTEVDLLDVTFLDCAGIGALVAARLSARGRDVFVSNAQGIVHRVLEITDVLPYWTTGRVPL